MSHAATVRGSSDGAASTEGEASVVSPPAEREGPAAPLRRRLCSLVGHRWGWEGQPGAADCRRRCLRCDRGRPAWRLDGAPHPAATSRVDHQANLAASNPAHVRDAYSP